MLQAYVMPRVLGLHGYGLGAASTAIKALQQALQSYAATTNYPLANPGPIDGFMGLQTRNAVLNILPRLPKLPSAVKTVLSFGVAASIIPDVAAQIDSIITQYAVEITTAIKLLQIAQTPSAPAPTTPTGAGTTATTTSPAPAPAPAPAASGGSAQPPAWYKTGPGIAALSVGATAVMASAVLLASK